MEKIIKMFRKGFPYIDREEATLKKILENQDNIIIEKNNIDGETIAVSVINKNTILFFYVEEGYRGKGIGTSLLIMSEDVIKNNNYSSVVVGVGFDYIMPGVPTSKKYYPAVNEQLCDGINEDASRFFENNGYTHSWDCNCFDMKMKLNDFKKNNKSVNDTIKNITYRWATINDLQQIIDCADDACQFQDEKFSKYYKNQELYKENNNQKVLVAEKNNQIIGCIIVSIETEAKDLGNVGCTCVRASETHQGVASNMVTIGTKFLYDLGLTNASLSYTYSGLDKLYGSAGYKISCYYMMATKEL